MLTFNDAIDSPSLDADAPPQVSHAPTSPTEVSPEQRKSRMRATRIVGRSVGRLGGLPLKGAPLG